MPWGGRIFSYLLTSNDFMSSRPHPALNTVLHRTTLPDQLAERLQSFIAEKKLNIGDRLPAMSDLALRFRVGYPTLREGIKKLEALGMVSIRHGSGIYVNHPPKMFFLVNPVTVTHAPSRKVLCDLIEARMAIELQTIAIAAEKITPAQSATLVALLREARRLLADDRELNRVNTQIHLELAAASDNSVLAHLLDVILRLFQEEQRILLHLHGSPLRDLEEHRAIVSAVRQHRQTHAVKLMRAHLEGVRTVILRWDGDLSRMKGTM